MDLKSLIPFGKKTIPVRREDVDPFTFLRNEVNRMFDELTRSFWWEPFETRRDRFSPSVDVVENDKEIKITAELPGMDEKDIDVSIQKDVLTIRGEKKEEKEDTGKDYYRMERSYGSFSRSIPLPSEVDVDKIRAEFRKGLLTVILPKTPEAIKETRKIPIKAE